MPMKMKTNRKQIITLMLTGCLLLTGCGAKYACDAQSVMDKFTNSFSQEYTRGTISNLQPYEDIDLSYIEEEYNTEEYSDITENRFLSTTVSPLSTFAADVDTASYSNFRRYLNSNELPPQDSVRIEEMLNYFHYNYPEPSGTDPFSVSTEIYPCPWNEDTMLVQIGMQAKKVDTSKLPRQNLVFLIDVSGSMNDPYKLDLVKRAFLLLCEELRSNDTISIVTYASNDAVVLEGASGDEKDIIMNAIENLTAGGSTAGSAGIKTAYKIAEKYYQQDGNNRVILATDGDLNVGVTSKGDLERLISNKKKSGVYLSVMGFGTGNYKDNKLETLADKGNGNYSYIDTIYEARKVLVEELGSTLLTVAKDVKFQVEFNPSKVKGYRLVGYENRLMNAEDFADDTKDGGEIGSGHRVTVLYEIALSDSKMEFDRVDLKYQQNETNTSNELFTVSVRYKEPTADKSTLLTYPIDETSIIQTMSDNMKLASSIAEVGMLVRNSEFVGTANYKEVLSCLDSISWLANDRYASEFRGFVEQLSSLDK